MHDKCSAVTELLTQLSWLISELNSQNKIIKYSSTNMCVCLCIQKKKDKIFIRSMEDMRNAIKMRLYYFSLHMNLFVSMQWRRLTNFFKWVIIHYTVQKHLIYEINLCIDICINVSISIECVLRRFYFSPIRSTRKFDIKYSIP